MWVLFVTKLGFVSQTMKLFNCICSFFTDNYDSHLCFVLHLVQILSKNYANCLYSLGEPLVCILVPIQQNLIIQQSKYFNNSWYIVLAHGHLFSFVILIIKWVWSLHTYFMLLVTVLFQFQFANILLMLSLSDSSVQLVIAFNDWKLQKHNHKISFCHWYDEITQVRCKILGRKLVSPGA